MQILVESQSHRILYIKLCLHLAVERLYYTGKDSSITTMKVEMKESMTQHRRKEECRGVLNRQIAYVLGTASRVQNFLSIQRLFYTEKADFHAE